MSETREHQEVWSAQGTSPTDNVCQRKSHVLLAEEQRAPCKVEQQLQTIWRVSARGACQTGCELEPYIHPGMLSEQQTRAFSHFVLRQGHTCTPYRVSGTYDVPLRHTSQDAVPISEYKMVLQQQFKIWLWAICVSVVSVAFCISLFQLLSTSLQSTILSLLLLTMPGRTPTKAASMRASSMCRTCRVTHAASEACQYMSHRFGSPAAPFQTMRQCSTADYMCRSQTSRNPQGLGGRTIPSYHGVSCS